MRFFLYFITPKGSLLSASRAFGSFAFFFLQAIFTHSQDTYILQHYTSENGLPAVGIKGIELDRATGFLWVGTQGGLVRFDGASFKSFDAKNAASRVSIVSKNRQGDIFFEFDNYSVYRVINNRVEFVTTDTIFMPASRQRGGIVNMRPVDSLLKKIQTLDRSSFLPNWVLSDEPENSNDIWFTYFGHAYYYQANKDTLLDFPGFDDILSLDGKVYTVAHDHQLWTYNDSLQALMRVTIKGMPGWDANSNMRPQWLWKRGMKNPLLSYDRNIWKLEPTGREIQLTPLCISCYPKNAYISNAQVWEEQGIIFLSSESKGLFVIKTPFLHPVRPNPSTETGGVEYAQAEFVPGTVTTASGLLFSSIGQLLPGKAAIKFPSSNIYRDRHGDYWFSSKDTIIHYYPRERRFTKIATDNNDQRIVFAETNDRIFVISEIAIADITGDKYHLKYKLPPVSTQSNSLSPDDAIEWAPGILGIASDKLLLFNTVKGGNPDTLHIPGLTTKVRTLFRYGDYTFIGTYGQGFYIYKNGVVKKIPLDKSRYLSFTHCFMADKNGNCWISTNRGLFKVSMKTLLEAFERDLPEIYYHYFGRNDGAFNTEFNGGCQPCALELSSGMYSFPTMNGMMILDPLGRHSPPPIGKIFIDEVRVDTLICNLDDNVLNNLSYPISDLRFTIELPHFGNPENIYFSYKLEPFHDEWQSQGIVQNNVLQFGGLRPGYYKLFLRVRSGFEADQFEITVIEFRILKAWYQRWWFYLLCLLAFILITWGLVRWRTATIARRKKELQRQVAEQTEYLAAQSTQLENQLRQLKEQQEKLEVDNQVKARLIAIISHDMITPLKFMVLVGKKLRDAFSSSDPIYGAAESLVTVTQELESLSVNMLNWIRFHHDASKLTSEDFDLHELVSESAEIASTLANEKNVKLYNDIPEATYITQYQQAIGVIIYNLAMNAAKHTEAGEIRIACGSTGDLFSVSVTDSGRGMPPDLVDMINSSEAFISDYSAGEAKKFRFGYLIIKDLLQLIDGSIEVESTLNKGTTVAIRFKSFGKQE